MKRRKPIRKVSEHRQGELRHYYARRRRFLAMNPHCVAFGVILVKGMWDQKRFCERLATDVHHRRGRAGQMLLLEKHWLPVCRKAHIWIEDHPDAARILGLGCEKGKWLVP